MTSPFSGFLATGHTLAVLLAVSVWAPAGCIESEGKWVQEFDGHYYHMGKRVDGKKHGLWRMVGELGVPDEDNIVDVSYWRHGLAHGPYRSYLLGELTLDVSWQNGQRHGRDRIFSEPGVLKQLGWWVRGKKDGDWCHWDWYGGFEGVQRFRGGALLDYDTDVRACPHLHGDGRRHLDEDDRSYLQPGDRGRAIQGRYLPLPMLH